MNLTSSIRLGIKLMMWLGIVMLFGIPNSLYSQSTEGLNNLEILTSGYPKAFFFRSAAGKVDWPYNKWDKTYNRLGGIIGKTLNEEIPGRQKSISYFSKFKKEHPGQMVLLHYNGNARDPRDESWKFYPGHWLYFKGTKILKDIPKESGLTEIKVEDPSIFYTNIGRYKNANEDIGLARIGSDGKPDWGYSEQVQLISVNNKKSTIKIRRGQYHSTLHNFKGGKAIAAPHVYEGPWGKRNHIMWLYNHSTVCPKDSLGRTADDILVKEFSKLFGNDGRLQWYNGVEFDVLWNEISHQAFGRIADVNNDGKEDGGILKGANVYSIGVYKFIKKMRRALGKDRLILADGMTSQFQRGFKYLNGIESEGWPIHRDPEVNDWSGGWNRHLFWNQNSYKPSFSYINVKYIKPLRPQPISRTRIMLAAAPLLSAGIADGGILLSNGKTGIFDEFLDGAKQKKNWLGKPLDKPKRLALQKPDLLSGAGKVITDDFISGWEGEDINFEKDKKSIKIISSKDDGIRFKINGIPANGPDLVVSMKVRAKPRKEYPEGMARLLNVWRKGDHYKLMTWVNDKWFHATFYFRDIKSNSIDLFFEIESNEPLWISDFTVHAYPDAVYREFENGLVLANPAHHPFTFDIKAIDENKNFKRLNATKYQDEEVNSGVKVGKKVTLGERTGLFLETANKNNNK